MLFLELQTYFLRWLIHWDKFYAAKVEELNQRHQHMAPATTLNHQSSPAACAISTVQWVPAVILAHIAG